MRRRQALRMGGLICGIPLVNGCLGIGSNEYATQGDDDDPFDTDPEDLLLPEESLAEVLKEGWVEEHVDDRGMFRGTDAAVEYVPYDEEDGFHMDSGVVRSGVWLYDDVESARETYDDHPYHEGWGFEEQPVAIESIAGNYESKFVYGVLFRDANAIGALQYNNSHEPDTLTDVGLELAAAMHESWRSD